MTNTELIMLQSLPLDIKIAKTKLRIKEYVSEFGIDNVYVAYSGGKDSEVLLDICRQIYPNIKAVFSNTGQEFPETIKQVLMRKNQGYNIDIVIPKMRYVDVVKEYGYPVVSKNQAYYIYQYRNSNSEYMKNLRWNGGRNGKSFKISEKYKYLVDATFKISDKCCEILKKRPMKEYGKKTGRKAIVGVMAEESKSRKDSYLKTGCNSFDQNDPQSKPLGFWKEQDIWDYIKEFNLEISEMYTKHGASRTGCYGCLFGCNIEQEKTGTNRIVELKKTHPKLFNHLMNDLNYKEIMDYLGLKTENTKYIEQKLFKED
jgi:3'-phosphoadenosine 5'-phosphosulfate sulfotransferase (PAPS reductase)/FAD synthetase